MKRVLLLFFLLNFLLIIRSQIKYSKYVIPNYYNMSQITQSQSTTLKKWIIWKSNFPRWDVAMNPIYDKSFKPESRIYKEGIVMIGLFYMIYFIVGVFLFILVISCRIICKRCGANYKIIELTPWTLKIPLIIWIIGLSIIIASFIVGGIGNGYSYININNSTLIMESEGEIAYTTLVEDAQSVSQFSIDINYAGLIHQGKLKNLLPEFEIISNSTTNFALGAHRFEFARFTWYWFHMFFCIIGLTMGIISYFKKHNTLFLAISTIFLATLFLEAFLLLAYSTSEFFIILDACEQIFNIVENNTLPVNDTGIAYFLKPISNDAKGIITAQQYSVAIAYNTLYAKFYTKCSELLATNPQIYTMSDLQQIMLDSRLGTNVELINLKMKIENLYQTLITLFDLKNSRHLRKFARDSELPLCITSIKFFLFAYFGLVGINLGLAIIVLTQSRMYAIKKKKVLDPPSASKHKGKPSLLQQEDGVNKNFDYKNE